MFFEMLAYLVWIMFTLFSMGVVFHILRMDRPRSVPVDIRKDDYPY